MPAKVTALKSESTANPEIKEIAIGIRQLRTIKIYPLSAKDQIALSNRLITVLGEMGTSLGENVTNEDALTFFQNLIIENLEVILEYVVDKEELPSMDELTNSQLYSIAETIFVVNYEGCLKNFVGLFQRAKGILA